MRQPSLYKYFPSLHAVYDALFARGVTGARRGHARQPSPKGPRGVVTASGRRGGPWCGGR